MSVYDRCRYSTLLDLATARHLPLPNRQRATVTAALLAADQQQGNMALDWQHIATPALNEAAARAGIIFQQADDRAARVAVLQAANITPLDCIRQLMPPPAQSGPQPNKVVLQRQLDTEAITTFLDRAAMVLADLNITDPEKNRQLLNAAQPKVAEVIIQQCGNNPQITFQDLVGALRTIFAIQPSTAGTQFQQAKPATGESYVDFGRKLQHLYLQFLGEDRTAAQQHARWITPPLVMKLLSVVPHAIRGHLQVAYDANRLIGWTQFCLLADSFVANQPIQKTPYNQRTSLTNKPEQARPKQLCAKHGLGAHSTAECRALRQPNTNDPIGHQQQQRNPRRNFNMSAVEPQYHQPDPNEYPTLGQGVNLERGQEPL
jgi:hypothetical protein